MMIFTMNFKSTNDQSTCFELAIDTSTSAITFAQMCKLVIRIPSWASRIFTNVVIHHCMEVVTVFKATN